MNDPTYSDTFHLRLIYICLIFSLPPKKSYYLQSLAWTESDVWCLDSLWLIVIDCTETCPFRASTVTSALPLVAKLIQGISFHAYPEIIIPASMTWLMSPIYSVDTNVLEPLDKQVYRNYPVRKKWDIPAVRAFTNENSYSLHNLGRTRRLPKIWITTVLKFLTEWLLQERSGETLQELKEKAEWNDRKDTQQRLISMLKILSFLHCSIVHLLVS